MISNRFRQKAAKFRGGKTGGIDNLIRACPNIIKHGSLGANGLRTFLRVTLPNVKWALLYGVLLCNARAMGEFGAVSVVSGHIRGETNTMPLQVEALYNDYDFVGAFAVASLLALLAILTLVLKSALEWRHRDAIAAHR